MAKKREHRTGPSTEPELTRKVSTARSPSSRTEPARKLMTTTTVVLFLIVVPAISFVVYRTLYSTNTSTNPNLTYVYQRGLVDTDINYRQVLADNMKTSENSSSRNFKNPVLAYVTPWNSQGYDIAKKFSNKFTHISPVWYELKSQGTKLVLEGRHNADKGWISEIRTGNAQILPRVVLEANPLDLLKKQKQKDKAVNLIITECREMDYDGIVLESWSRWAAYGVLHDPDLRNMGLQFIRQLRQAMDTLRLEQNRSRSLELVYVIGPPRSEKLEEYDFGPEDVQSLSDAVDGFSLMTYDFSGPQNPGPNAPLKWVHFVLTLLLDTRTVDQNNNAKKIFIGINFYGNDFVVSGGLGGGPIVGKEYISLLEKYRPELHWEKNSGEHYFLYIDNQDVKHVVFYPSLMSVAMRLEEARSWGAGISIWEIGQGLEYFFDIF